MKPVNDVLILRVQGGAVEEILDEVATETHVTLYVNEERVLGFLCSPGDIDALAVGFARSEGWLKDRAALREVDFRDEPREVRLTIEGLPDGWKRSLSEKVLSSGCGAGATFGVGRTRTPLSARKDEVTLTPETIRELLKIFRERADLYERTGGVHSAALCSGGALAFYAEDIGRHNAVDKVIGRAVLEGQEPGELVLLCSGRLSSEMVSKAAASDIAFVISRAAPTCMSVAVAEDRKITLVGFARGGRMNIYTHPWRIRLEP